MPPQRRAFFIAAGTIIENCVVRNYHDGISFQSSNDVPGAGCVSEDNAGLGLGSGSQRGAVNCIPGAMARTGCSFAGASSMGCSENVFEENGRFGISIGHKDTDNLVQDNQVRANHQDGVFSRNKQPGWPRIGRSRTTSLRTTAAR
jgi:hypothetical protein